MSKLHIIGTFIVVIAVVYFIISKAQTAVSSGEALRTQSDASTQAEVDATLENIDIPR
jgi:uncharacterized membrane protein